MKRPPKDFDLSTSPMPGRYYVPPKARDPHEIARRHTLSSGELILEQQKNGLHIARLMLKQLTDKKSFQFALPIINTSLINTDWFMAGAPERANALGARRRRRKLPLVYEFASSEHMLDGVHRSLAIAEEMAAKVILLHTVETPQADKFRYDFSRRIGEASLAGAVLAGVGDDPLPGSPLRGQLLAREHGMRLIEGRAEMAEELGTAPSLAQFTDRYAPQTVHWIRNAPDQAVEVLELKLAA